MPAGQTPVTVTVVAHNDLVDAVQPGDRYVINLSMNKHEYMYL